MKNEVIERIRQSIDVKRKLMEEPSLSSDVERIVNVITVAFRNGNKVLFCGNGGSAADAQHLSAEFSGRFYLDRPPLFSEALHCNTSYITAVGNDYSFNEIYSRIVRGKCQKGDILIGLSTSGNSSNIVNAFRTAKEMGVITIGLTGEGGGKMADCSDYIICIPSTDVPRIQEAHILIGHIICEFVERSLFGTQAK